MSQEPTGTTWHLSVLVRCTLFLFVLFAVNSLFAATESQTDIGAKSAPSSLKGTIYASLEDVKDFDYATAPFTPKTDFFPKKPLTPKIYYVGRELTQYSLSETVPTLPGSYTVYIDVHVSDSANWEVVALQDSSISKNFEINFPMLVVTVDTKNIEAYDYTGSAIKSVAVKANGESVAGTWGIVDSDVILTVGSHIKTLTFTPTDLSYGPGTKDINIEVDKARLYLVLKNKPSITYEDPLSSANIVASFETKTDSKVLLTTVQGDTKYEDIDKSSASEIYPVVNQGAQTYSWTFTPGAAVQDSFLVYSNSQDEKIAINVARKSLDFGTDIKFDKLKRFYYDTDPATVVISHKFKTVLATCDSTVTYWNDGTSMDISSFQDWDAACYTVKATPVTTDNQNYTFFEKTETYMVKRRPIAKVVVDTFALFAQDNILTDVVKTFTAYNVKNETLAQESIAYTYAGYLSGIANADSMKTDTWHVLKIHYVTTDKNYAVLDTTINVFRFKDPVPFTWLSVGDINYPDTLGLAKIEITDSDSVISIEFVHKDSVYDVFTTRRNDNTNPTNDGRHKWIAKTSDKNFSDSESWSYVTIKQAIMPAHLKSTDTTQEWGKIKIPKLTYGKPWFNSSNVRDTAPYTVHFSQGSTSINHADMIKNPIGEYVISIDSVVDSSNYKINSFVDKFKIEPQKPDVRLITRALPVGLMLSRAIKSYEAKVKVQGVDSEFFGTLEFTNDRKTTVEDVGQALPVNYTLTPYDKNIATYRSTIVINVISSTFIPSDIAHSQIVYGKRLRETNLTMDNTDFASIQWDTPDVIPQVSDANNKSFAYTINVLYDPSQIIHGTEKIGVTPLTLTKENVIITDPINPIYDGKIKEPQISYTGLPVGSLTPTKPNISYNLGNIEPGKKTVYLTFRTNHSGTVEGAFNILPDPKLVENVTDTVKIYNGAYQYATVGAQRSGSTAATLDSVKYQLVGQAQWIDSPILAAQYNMKSTFSQAGAVWTRLDSFIINRQEVAAEHFVVHNTTTTVDSGLNVTVDFVGLDSIPADTEYIISYNSGTQTPTGVGQHSVNVTMTTNYKGSYQTTAIIKASPPPEMPPEIPVTPPSPPEIPVTTKEGHVGFINLPKDKNNASEDIKLALVSKFTTGAAKSTLIEEENTPIIVQITMSDDQLFNEELFFKGEKLQKQADKTYSIRLKYEESEWLSLRVNPQSAFLGTKKVTLRLAVASVDPNIRISGGVRSASVEYISNLIVIDEPPRFSVKTTSDKPYPDVQSLNLLRFINETNRDGIKVYLDDLFTAKGALISLESDSIIKYDYSTMDQASINALQTIGLEDTFSCKLTRNNAVTLVKVTVYTAHEHTLGTSLIIASSEVSLPVFEKNPSSKGQYIRPYEKVKPGKQAKVRNLSMKTTRTPLNDHAVLTVSGSVSLMNKKLFSTANKTQFTQDILAKDTAMNYQQKSLPVTVRLKLKQKYVSVDTQVRIVNIVPASFAPTDRFFGVSYLDPRNFKLTPYFYFEVQNCGLKPLVRGEYFDIKNKLRKVSFSLVKKDIEVNTAEGSPIRMTKAIIPGENGKLLIKHHKILDQEVGRLDLIIDNRNGVAARTIRGVK